MYTFIFKSLKVYKPFNYVTTVLVVGTKQTMKDENNAKSNFQSGK